MKGIYCVVNKYTGKVFYYRSTNNLENANEEFEVEKRKSRQLSRYKYIDNLEIKILEETEDLNKRLAYYMWPQISRVTYDESCYTNKVDAKTTERIINIIDWLVQTYPGSNNRFLIKFIEKKYNVYISYNNQIIEKYVFEGNKKEPSERTIL